MRIIFDIVHPAHVHFFKHIIRGLSERGHFTAVMARRKDVTSQLLDRLGFEYSLIGRAARKGRVGQLAELLERDFVLARFARRFGADVVVTRNPAGVHAARLAGALGIFDTDDGSAAGLHFWAAQPFAHYITSPDCLAENLGRRHIRYPGYKQSAYLHPDHFTPDPEILSKLGVSPRERFFIVRFVAMHASHDRGEEGMSTDAKRAVIDRLQQHGRVILSCESAVPTEWRHLSIDLPPDRFHDALAFADLVVGDSQTVAAESSMLGTPSLRVSSFAGRICYLEELEHRYGLTRGFHPSNLNDFFLTLDDWLRQKNLRQSLSEPHARMLSDKINIAQWFIDFVERVGRPR